ncbi:MAG TPA: universal stress protein [Ktedonobacteraceae bacterium]|nr:universal stress protein [Ktedonobacteraceae bacterium]
MYRKILVAYDGSKGARKAFEAALQLAETFQAELWALGVEEHLPHFAATIDEMEEEKSFANHYYEECLDIASAQAMKKGVKLKPLIRAGHVAHTILEVTREGRFDLLVMGHSGRSEAWTAFLGTTAEKVSRHAPCTVLIVR